MSRDSNRPFRRWTESSPAESGICCGRFPAAASRRAEARCAHGFSASAAAHDNAPPGSARAHPPGNAESPPESPPYRHARHRRPRRTAGRSACSSPAPCGTRIARLSPPPSGRTAHILFPAANHTATSRPCPPYPPPVRSETADRPPSCGTDRRPQSAPWHCAPAQTAC